LIYKGCWVLRGALVLLIASTLGSCALLTPPKAPSETYDISAPRSFSSLRSGTRAQLLIKEPTALKALDSQNIVVKPTPAVITYLGGAQWSDTLPKMLQSKLVEAFENTGRAGAVAKPGDGLVIDYQVISAIRAFEVAVNGGARQARFVLSVKLLNDKNGHVLRSKVFRANVDFAGSKNDDYVAALDQAFDTVARDLVVWVLNRI
jgi:cholesterol transport system auxiliary component